MSDRIRAIAEKVNALKRDYRVRDLETSKLRALRAGDWESLAPGAFTEDYPAPMVANRVEVMARDVAASLAPLPSVSCSAAGGAADTQRRFAEKRTKIANHYVGHSQLSAHQVEFADAYNYYGMGVYFIEPDFECSKPVIRARSGANVYATWDAFGDTTSAVEEWDITRASLLEEYPDAAAELGKSDGRDRFTVVRFSDRHETVMYVPALGDLILSSYKSPIPGKCQYVCIPRNGGSGNAFNSPPRGAYVDLIYPQLARHEFTNLMLEAAYKSVQSPVVVPQDVTSVPYGPDAVIPTQNPAGVGRMQMNVPQGAFQAMQTLDQDLAIGGMSPESRTGNIQASVITGKGIEAASAGFSSQIAQAQGMIGFGLKLAVQRCFAMDEHLWPNDRRDIKGIENGVPFVGTYISSKDIKGDYSVEVTYGFMLGMAPNNALVFLLQASAAGLISKDFATRQLPVGVNPTEEQKKIELEALRGSTLQAVAALAQAIPQLVLNGQDPGPVIGAVAEITRRIQKGDAIEEVVAEVFAPAEPEEPAAAAAPGEDPMAALMAAAGGGAPPDGTMASKGPGDRPDLAQFFAGMSSGGDAVLSGGVSRMDPAA